MEVFIFVAVICLFWWLISFIAEKIEKKRAEIRERVARGISKENNLEEKITTYLGKLAHIEYDSQIPYLSSGRTSVACSKCKQGHMEVRRGRQGKIFVCSNYPDCRNIKNSRDITSEYKGVVESQIKEDMIRAYFKI